ncbi:MAG: response regulator [Acidobacteriota bacterium]
MLRRRKAILVLLVALIGALLVATFGTAFVATRRTMAASRLERLRAVAKLATASYRERLDRVNEHLRYLASLGAGVDSARVREGAQGLRAGDPRLVRGVGQLGPDGSLLWSAPEGWLAREAELVEEGRSPSSGDTAVSQPIRGRDGTSALVLAVPLSPGGGPKRDGTLLCVLDIDALASDTMAMVAAETSGLAMLVSRGGGVLASAGGEGAPPSTLEAALPGDAVAAVRREIAAGARTGERLDVDMDGRSSTVLVASESARFHDLILTVVVVLPESTVRRESRAVLLAGGGILLAVLAAVAAGAAALGRAWRDSARSRADVERWRKQAEATERDRRGRFLSEEGREPAVYLKDLRVSSANISAVRSLEVGELADLLGRSFADFIVAEDRGRLERFLVGRVAGANVPEQFQTRLATARGGRRLVEMATSLVERDGTVFELVSWRDVTGRERAEALLRAAAAAVPAALVLCDSAGLVVWANGAAADTLRRPVERMHGRSLLPLVHQADRRKGQAMFGRALRSLPAAASLRMTRADGDVVLFDTSASPVAVAGELFGVLFAGQDVTQRAREAEQLERGRRGEVLGSLASAVAHRLNNAFQALLGIGERLREIRGLEAVRSSLVSVVDGAAQDLGRFVIAARSGPATLESVRLRTVAESWAGRAREVLAPGVRLSVRADSADDHVLVDGAQVELFLDLALAGALTSLRGGGAVEVTVGAADTPREVRLAVSDTAEVDSPGQPHRRDDANPLLPSRELAVAIAEVVSGRHGGRWGHKARPGIGTRVWLDFPVRLGSPAVPPKERPAARKGAVLVADDEELVRSALAELLRENGLEVVEAADGAVVVERVLAEPARFGLIVLDLVMPVMDGREALRVLRERAPEIPVLVCTGYDPAGDETLSSAEVLVKPVSFEDFVAKVREMLDVSGPPEPDGTMIS